MSTDKTSVDTLQKRRKSVESESNGGSKAKKPKTFSVKEFRKQLTSGEKLNALKEFLSVIDNSTGHDYIFDYLKSGGNCLELLQIIESDSTIPPVLVFDLVTRLLFKINASFRQYYSAAHESCKYLINNYLPLIHKMLGLSSSKEERRACLKLLTAMVTFSATLAKDILLNVKFHSANIELLSKHSGETNSVRDCFILFLTAFLVDTDLHTLSILLEKSTLLTGIISGLQYDGSNTVCLVVTAMKNHILENGAVMKTTKMHVFNTAVVRDIVNLYNWKGPGGLMELGKNHRLTFEVDKVEKSKVSECVHEFLLVLCTSHKYGVIFRDHLVGLGKKNQNGLMFTVLESLDRPWEHSYARELVLNICRSCPDLTKNLWLMLKPFLEPRVTEKWLNAMNFAKELIKVMEPNCVEYCVKDLSPLQLTQIMEFLISPSPILKVVLNIEKTSNGYSVMRQHVSRLLRDMLEKCNNYLSFLKNQISPENNAKIKQYLSNYINRTYPNAEELLEDWKTLVVDKKSADSDIEAGINIFSYLETILDILYYYKTIAPQLLSNFRSSNLDLKELLELTVQSNEENRQNVETLQMKIIHIFIDIDSSCCLPKSQVFDYVIPLLLKMYHSRKDKEAFLVLRKILKNTGIFDDSCYELDVWLKGICNFDNWTEGFGDYFVNLIRSTVENNVEYQKELGEINTEAEDQERCDDFLNNLLDACENDEYVRTFKHRHLGPLIVGMLTHLQHHDVPKSMKKYCEFVILGLFHCQTSLQKFLFVIQKYSDWIPVHVVNYINNWTQTSQSITKIKGNAQVLKILSESFLNDDINETVFEDHPDYLLEVLQMFTFYFSNLVAFRTVSEKHSKNWTALIDFMLRKKFFDINCMETVLENPLLIRNFNIIHFAKTTPSGICTKAIVDVLRKLGASTDVEDYIRVYSDSVYDSLIKIMKKPKKFLTNNNNNNIVNVLEVCSLSYRDCLNVFTKFFELYNDSFEFSENVVILDIVTYCLERFSFLCNLDSALKPLEKSILFQITTILTRLNEGNKDSGKLPEVLRSYLELFPHGLSDIDGNLYKSILQLDEFNKDNAALAILLLEKDSKFADDVIVNIDRVVEKKGLVLPLVEVLVTSDVPEGVLKTMYEKLETSILKALQKPQKVGQHFLKNYNIGPLIEKFMPVDKCKTFSDKTQKFEVTEVFHLRLLEACYNKILQENKMSSKQVCSIIMTFVHLEMTVLKKSDDMLKLNLASEIFNGILNKLVVLNKTADEDLSQVVHNETFKSFCKFSLKYGISGQYLLLRVLGNLIEILKDFLSKDDAELLLDMLLSHSEFLNAVLVEQSDTKLEILNCLLTICRNWNVLMEKSHVAVILAAYGARVTKCDRMALALLKLYESKAEQTHFYDFKPFLWGRAAATHYSVRTQIESSLIKQPKISDVLGILKEDVVNLTIRKYPLNDHLSEENEFPLEDVQCYDLKFLLPLFSHLLAPEQQVRTYIFTRSGALSLTIVGLSSQDREVRQAACHVLSRFHFHLEARQSGKDTPLWIRFVEALCKGVAVLPDFKLNNFVSTFYARMALILTNPKDVMYTPLSLYLTAKQELDLSTVPELYTLLFSSDVNYKEHRLFILHILRDGLRTEKDFVDFLRSMGHKLLSEFFSSCLSDVDSRLLILEVLLEQTKLTVGVKVLCKNYSLIPQLQAVTHKILEESRNQSSVVQKLLSIYLNIVQVKQDLITNQIILNVFLDILKSDNFSHLKDPELFCFYKVLYTIFKGNSNACVDKQRFLSVLSEKVNDKFLVSTKEYGCKYVSEKDFDSKDKNYFLRLLVLHWYR